MTTAVPLDVDLVKSEIKKTYASVSQEPEKDFIFPTGRAWNRRHLRGRRGSVAVMSLHHA